MYQNVIVIITCIKNVWQWGIQKMCPLQCLKKSQMYVNEAWTIVCPHSVSENNAPPPSLAHLKSTLPFFSDCPNSIKCLKQNVTPSPYHAHAKKSTTLKHVKTFICSKFIFYIPKLFLNENRLSKTIIKMFDSETWTKFTILQCLKKIKCVSMRHKKICRPSMSEKNAPPLLGLKITHSFHAPLISSLWNKMSTTPLTIYIQKINYPQHVKKCNPLRLIFHIPKFNCFYNFYKKNVTVRHDKYAVSEKTQLYVNEIWTTFCPLVSVWKQCTPQIHPFQFFLTALQALSASNKMSLPPLTMHMQKHQLPSRM